VYDSERKHNPLVNTALGGRTLSATQLPFFLLHPPSGYGVLTTTGRRSGEQRRRCIRAIRRDQTAYLVAIKGDQTGWLKNIRANPEVRLRIRGGTFAGVARELVDGAERQEAMEAYCETVNPFEYLECAMWRRGRPTRSKIKQLHRSWFEQGIPLAVDLTQ
jgi:deazaflavin-dependent oxidoreductase (nitroreductase family)